MIAAMATTRRADMFTADGEPSDDDPRENEPRLGDERVTLVESLRCARLTLEMKCSGLDAEAMARRSVEPSTMSLRAVRYLAELAFPCLLETYGDAGGPRPWPRTGESGSAATPGPGPAVGRGRAADDPAEARRERPDAACLDGKAHFGYGPVGHPEQARPLEPPGKEVLMRGLPESALELTAEVSGRQPGGAGHVARPSAARRSGSRPGRGPAAVDAKADAQSQVNDMG